MPDIVGRITEHVQYYPDRREGCCVCPMRGAVDRLIKRVAELERKQAGIEGAVWEKVGVSGEKAKARKICDCYE